MTTGTMQLGALDFSRSVASVRDAALKLNPLDERVQAGNNLPVLINQFNLEMGRYKRISAVPAPALESKILEYEQRLEILRNRLSGLRASFASAVEAMRTRGYITNDEAAATGAYSTALGVLPLAVVVIVAIAAVAIVVGVAAVVGLFGPSWIKTYQAGVVETARAKALGEWIEAEIERASSADATGVIFTPAPIPPILAQSAPGDAFDAADAAAGFGVGVLLVGALALFALSRRRRS